MEQPSSNYKLMGAIWAVGTEAELYDFYRSEIHYIIFSFLLIFLIVTSEDENSVVLNLDSK